MLSDIAKKLKHRLALPLPGSEAQLRMAHAERRLNLNRYKIPADARWSSVLILLYEENNHIRFPLILRPDYDGVHSGQIAFPGGKFEAEDQTLAFTALRECEEEIGIVAKEVEIIGRLTDLYIPPSNFLVHPHVGTLSAPPDFSIDKKEVAEIITPDLDILMDERSVREKDIKLSNGTIIRTPVFIFSGHTVWGATAMMLSELKTVLFELEI